MSWSRGRWREWWTSLELYRDSDNRELRWSRLWYSTVCKPTLRSLHKHLCSPIAFMSDAGAFFLFISQLSYSLYMFYSLLDALSPLWAIFYIDRHVCPLKTLHLHFQCILMLFFFQDQYIFIHDAILESVTCGDTEIEAGDLRKRLAQLKTTDESGRTGLDLQFAVRKIS